jgi:hypothetical protein
MRPQQRGGRLTAVSGLLLLLISGAAASAAAVASSPFVITNLAADGEPFQAPSEPAHVWVAGDIFSLHGVDQYRYIVVYTRETADGLVHGCYGVDHQASGRYVVSQYVHGQEVFGDAFIAEQDGQLIENVPLDQVVITDDTPVAGGKTYFGQTLGSIYGAANAPGASISPEPAPTAPRWPSVAPTQATPAPTTAPSGVTSVTRTPGPEPTVPGDAQPFPVPTVVPTAGLITATEPTVALPTSVPGAATVIEPTPAISSRPFQAWSKRFASWQAPSIGSRRVAAGIASGQTVTTGTRGTWTATRTFDRFYPRWSSFGRASS